MWRVNGQVRKLDSALLDELVAWMSRDRRGRDKELGMEMMKGRENTRGSMSGGYGVTPYPIV